MLALTSDDWLAIERELAARSLAEFAKMAWPILEPATPLKWGWALDAICEHLEALARREVKRLLMNVPPGCMKSLLTGVIYPAWVWGPLRLAERRFLSTAHKQDLAIRDNLKCRRLIQSDWYQARWPIALTSDQNAKTKFENDRTGFREAMAFSSMTGSRGDDVVLDDPLSVDDANSDAALLAAERTFLEALPTRVNNDQSAIVVIMQRLHQRDTSGLILARDLGYTHLCLPMRFEPERACSADRRTKAGELLFPDRFPEADVIALEKTLGSYATAGQLQQRPAPREGGMFKRHWFNPIPAEPAGAKWVRGWDLAASVEKDSAFTAGVRMGRTPEGRFVIAHAARDRLTAGGVEKLMKAIAVKDGRACQISLPQDPGQAGKAQAQYLVKQLAGYVAKATPESGDKIDRAEPLSAQAEAGNVDILVTGDPAQDAWIEPFMDEICVFPGSQFKDQTDAASRAFMALQSARAVVQSREMLF